MFDYVPVVTTEFSTTAKDFQDFHISVLFRHLHNIISLSNHTLSDHIFLFWCDRFKEKRQSKRTYFTENILFHTSTWLPLVSLICSAPVTNIT